MPSMLRALRLALGCTSSLVALAAFAPSASALEDHIVMSGRFEWIVPDDVADMYPNGELNFARVHLVKKFEATRGGDGLFKVELTLPSSLTAGQTVVATYKQVPTPDGEDLKFVNQSIAGDYLICSPGTDSWVDVYCGDVKSLKQARVVPVAQRKSYAQGRFGGSSMGTGMIAFASAEPGGTLDFEDTTAHQVAPWLGVWKIEYTTPQGQVVKGTMEIDGFTGIYRPDAGTARGVFRHLSVGDDGILYGSWEMGGARGWSKFGPLSASGTFRGGWGMEDDSDTQLGTWTGHR